MKTSKYSDSLIMSILNQTEAGTPVPNLCREHWGSTATFIGILVSCTMGFRNRFMQQSHF